MVQTKVARYDAAFIRKSTQTQDEGGQIKNVENMLRDIGVHVSQQHWYVGTVSRRKVKANADFTRLMDAVQAGRVGTVYIESQDRWGTADRAELFTLLGILRECGTRLYDLRAKKDLTERDLATEMLAFVNSIKSEKELQDISYRSLRTRVNNFKDSGSWPTGTHPFGYGKACYAADGRLLWVWQPVSRARGQVYYPGDDGRLAPGTADVAIPRKTNDQRVVLVPNTNERYVCAVRLVFELYTRVGLSRRQISARLNAEGFRFYNRPFSHTFVTQILQNPAYAGDTHFGKTRVGELHTFDDKGLVIEAKHSDGKRKRNVEERLVKENTHEPLIDRQTWILAEQKLVAEQKRTSYAPRNPAYYLKQLFVCGHCGRGMVGRTETDRTTRRQTVVYVCPTYVAGRCNGHETACGYHRITHMEAEQLLLGKITEANLRYDDTASDPARLNIENRLQMLGHEDDASREQWLGWVHDGTQALLQYLAKAYAIDDETIERLGKLAMRFYRWGGKMMHGQFGDLPLAVDEFRRAVAAAEALAVTRADHHLAKLTEEHRQYTKAWAKATDLMQATMKEELVRLEAGIAEWRPRTIPLTDRLRTLCEAEDSRQQERDQLIAEWPTLESRERGEALRRLFHTVTLFWDRTFVPAAAKPTRPRKTTRAGRYRYTLRYDRTQWAFATADLGGCW